MKASLDPLKRILIKAGRIYFFLVPSLFVLIGLVLLVAKTISEFYRKGDFSLVSVYYFPAIAAALAFATVSFTYAEAIKKDDLSGSKRMILVAELFFYAATSFSIALLAGWLAFELNAFASAKSIHILSRGMSILASIILGSAQLFLLYTTTGLHKGLVNLEDHLWSKVRANVTSLW